MITSGSNDIEMWLHSIGLPEYVTLFRENDLNVTLLPDLTNDDLKELGITSLGHRKQLLKAIAELRTDKKSDTPEAVEPTATTEAERRQLTVMFCDLVGSTALSARYDPEDLSDIVRTYQDACAGIISRYEGHVARFMGDGMLVYFGYPQAHEDDAERALRTGLEIIERVGQLKPRDNLTLQTRVGVATGLVVVGETIGEASSREQVVMGETPNLAARLQGLAEPNQIVIAESTHRLCGDVFEYDDLGEQNLKGFDDSISAYAVVGERSIESRFAAHSGQHLLPIIGREQEIGLLAERWRLAKAGEGQLVLLTGEAGIGKSRITRAMIDAVAEENHYRINYQCSPYHSDSALYPTIRQLTLASNITSADDLDTRFDKLDALLRQAGDISAEQSVLMATLIGLDGEGRYGALDLTPQQKRAHTLQALVDQLLGLSKQKPVLFILEDAHWIDPTTQELIDLFLDAITDAPVLILVTARPTFEHGFGGHPIVTRLMLNRLGREHTTAIVARLTNNKTLPDELLDEIAVKTDGVPLFVEEMTKAVLESGVTGIPASLHDSLMSRLDRIPVVKEAAQIAATIGRTFDYELLKAIADRPEADLVTCLEKLAEAELVFCRGRPPEATYTFKHALVRDAAYESLLKSRRQDLHGKIAEALVAMFPETAEAQPELLAQHYMQAGLHWPASEKWLLAGDRSARRAANREAIAQLRRGLNLVGKIEEGPRRWRLELDLVMSLGGCLRTLKGWIDKETVETVTQARRLCDLTNHKSDRGVIGIGEYTIHLLRGEVAKAVECGRDLLRLAEEDSGVALYVGHRATGATLVHMGRFDEARRHLEAGLSDYDPSSEQQMVHKIGYYSGVTLHCYLAHALWYGGFPDQSLESLNRAVSLAEEQRHPPSQAFALFQACFHHSHLMRNDEAALRVAIGRFQDLAQEGGFATWSAFVESQQACLACDSGDATAGFETVLRNLEWWKVNAGVLVLPAFYEMLARAQSSLGRRGDAVTSVDAAIDLSNRFGEQLYTAELHRGRGDLLSGGGSDGSEAREACYQKALAIARDQSSRTMELRAANSLARLWADQGEYQKAQDMLAPLYSWFTEGFDTPDLKDAKTLLAELE